MTSGSTKKIYYTSGHGENTFSTSVSELFEKNMTEAEVNLIMDNKIPDDCDLLFINAPTKDITEDEKNIIRFYMQEGGKVFILLAEESEETSNLDTLMEEYGIQREKGYIADMQRCYPEIVRRCYMKQRRNMLLVLGILIVLVIIYLSLNQWNKSKEKD